MKADWKAEEVVNDDGSVETHWTRTMYDTDFHIHEYDSGRCTLRFGLICINCLYDNFEGAEKTALEEAESIRKWNVEEAKIRERAKS